MEGTFSDFRTFEQALESIVLSLFHEGFYCFLNILIVENFIEPEEVEDFVYFFVGEDIYNDLASTCELGFGVVDWVDFGVDGEYKFLHEMEEV